MRREDAIPGVEFGLNDFRPNRRGTRSPSAPSRRRPSRKREFYIALAFMVCACLIIAVFRSLERSSVPNRQAARPRIAYRQTPEKAPIGRAENRTKTDDRPADASSIKSMVIQQETFGMSSENRRNVELDREIQERMKSLSKKIDDFLARH